MVGNGAQEQPQATFALHTRTGRSTRREEEKWGMGWEEISAQQWNSKPKASTLPRPIVFLRRLSDLVFLTHLPSWTLDTTAVLFICVLRIKRIRIFLSSGTSFQSLGGKAPSYPVLNRCGHDEKKKKKSWAFYVWGKDIHSHLNRDAKLSVY